jgi:1,4-dihydroxy-2-naphthoate octaprenyltransferase
MPTTPATASPDDHPAGLGTLNRWWLAIRPKTLPAAASSVIVGTALAWRDGGFLLGPALAALSVALLLQIGSNLANDVYDDERGADTADRLGPVRVTQSGLLSREQVKRGMKVVFALAFAVGIYLTFVRGVVVLVIGAAAIVAAVAYTGGPYPLGYHGLGEVFVFLFFGLTSVVGTYWVQTGTAPALTWLMAAAIGSIVTAIIVVNNLRDVEQDRAAGKRTVAVRIGALPTKVEYATLMALPYALLTVLVTLGALPMWALLTWLSLPVALRATRRVFTQTGRVLNIALAETGQTALAYSALFAIGLVLAR